MRDYYCAPSAFCPSVVPGGCHAVSPRSPARGRCLYCRPPRGGCWARSAGSTTSSSPRPGWTRPGVGPVVPCDRDLLGARSPAKPNPSLSGRGLVVVAGHGRRTRCNLRNARRQLDRRHPPTWIGELRPNSVGAGSVTDTGVFGVQLPVGHSARSARPPVPAASAQSGASTRTAPLTPPHPPPCTCFNNPESGVHATSLTAKKNADRVQRSSSANKGPRDISGYATWRRCRPAGAGDGAVVATGSRQRCRGIQQPSRVLRALTRLVNAPDVPAANTSGTPPPSSVCSPASAGTSPPCRPGPPPCRSPSCRPGDLVYIYRRSRTCTTRRT